MLSSVTKGSRRDKLFVAEFTDGTRVHFGGAGYDDYTSFPADVRDEKRRLYRLRHAGDRLDSPRTAGALSYYLLWGESADLSNNIRSFKKRFKI